MKPINVYQMYYDNQKKYGYFIQRDTWEKWIAQVILIEGVQEGEDIPGIEPYFKSQKIIGNFYKYHSDNFWEYQNTQEISCPGTFAYSLLNSPKHILVIF